MNPRHSIAWIAILALVATSAPLRAQSPTAVVQRSCRAIGPVEVPGGLRGDTTALRRAEDRARQCALAEARELAELLRTRAPTQQDVVALDSLVEAATVNDASIFEASYALARNRGATLPARIAGLRLAGRLLDGAGSGTTLAYARPEAITDVNVPCAYAVLYMPPPDFGNPIVGDLPSAVRDLTDGIARDVTEPVPLRAIARCMRRHFAPSYVEYPPASAIELSYHCGLVFRVRNRSDVAAPLTYAVRGSTDHGGIRVQPHSEQLVIVLAKGDLLLSMNGVVIRTAAFGDRRCR